MTKLIVLDDGHGMETAGKRTPPFPDGTVIRENQFNRAVVKKLGIALLRCGFRVEYSAPTDEDTPLALRTKKANDLKADAIISIHYNAFNSKWDETKGGVESLYQPGNADGKLLAECIHNSVKLGTQQVDRGAKAQNLYILRNFNGPGALIECGFMDVMKEAKLMLDDSFQTETAEQVAQGICRFFRVRYVVPGKETVEVCSNKVTVKMGVMTLPMVAELRNGITFVNIGGVWIQASDLAKALGANKEFNKEDKILTLKV